MRVPTTVQELCSNIRKTRSNVCVSPKCHSQYLIIPDKFKEFKTISDDVEASQEFFMEDFRFPE
jgi:hypothetical protein